MEQHPIPRNISGFQFHLIGDMTVRQFAYLAAGVLSAIFIYKTAPFPGIIKLPLAGFLGLAGFSFAFLPIQERPLDKWLLAFIRSITSPTQYLWIKNNSVPDFLTTQIYFRKSNNQTHQEIHQDAKEKLKLYLQSLPKSPHEALNLREKKYIDSTLSLFQTQGYSDNFPKPTNISYNIKPVSSPRSQITAPAPIQNNLNTQPNPAVNDIKRNENQAVNAKNPPVNTSLNKTSLTPPPPEIPTAINAPILQQVAPSIPSPHADLSAIKKQMDQLLFEKKLLEEELSKIKNQHSDNSSVPGEKNDTATNTSNEPTIKTITRENITSEMGMPSLSQVPNIVAGVVKDPQKKILPNIILTIKDKKGVPFRALKTNKLGQFAAATPLPNGTYLLETEDPLKRYVFDIAEITTNGKLFLPLEITAKGQKELMREKLTKELFSNISANI